MRALVTGGAGFIGSNLVRELMRIGWSVHIVDDLSSGRISLIPEAEPDQVGPTVDIASFTDPYILDKIGLKNVDIIFHQAAIPRVSYSVAQPILTMQTNLLATAKLFRAAAERDVPVVWASSSSVYGGAEFLPTHESERGKFLPKSPYAMQKYHSEDYAALFGELYGLRSFGLRYFNVFGPGQYAGGPYSTAVAAWCHAIKNGEECRSDGDGTQSRDMCYVDNVVHANIQAAKVLLDGCPWAKMGRCYNIALGDRVSNNEILEFLQQRFGARVRIRHAPPRAGDVMHTQADIGRAKEELGYDPKVRFWDGLRRTLIWWGLEETR